MKLGNALGELTTTSAAAVDGGKANVTLTGSATDKTAKLAFAYTNAKSKREAQIEKAKDPETNADWLECVDMKDVSLETVFENFTDTITFPVTRTEGEDAGSYKLYLDAKDVTYANAKASNYALTIPEAFASKDVDADAKQYVFTINPVKLTLSLSDETYTKTYGDNDPVYATNDLTTVSTNNRANATPEKSKNSTTLTLTYPMGFTDTLVVAPTRGSGEDAKSGYELSLTDSNISTSATDKADKDIAGERTGADVKENYTFDLSGYENNTLTINERTLTFTPDKSSYTYGELKPGELAGTFTGLANNESIGVEDSGVATIPEKASTAGYLNAGDYKYTTEADGAGGEGGASGSEEAVPTTDGKKINFAITNTKWVEDAANATTLADTTANYTISISPTPLAVNAATLTVTGNSVNVTKGTTPTAANIAALATLSGVLTNDGKKDDVTLSVTEYTADVNKDGTTEDYNDAATLITAIGNAGGLTTNLTVTVDYTVSGSDKENYSLASGTADGTLVAYTASSGGGGGYVAPVVPSTTTDNVINSTENKTATTTATVNPATITVSGVPTTTVTVSDATGTKIVEKAVANKSAEVVINAATGTTVKEAKAGTVTEISISAATLSQIVAKTDAAVIIKSDVANVTLDRKAVEAVVATAGTSGTVKLVVKTVAQDANKVQVELKIETANGTVSDFNGGNVKVTVKLSAALAAKDLVCVYIDDNGVYYKVEGTKNADGTYTFTTGHFSSYAVMAAEDADKVIAEQAAKATDLTKDLTLKARSVKTAKGNIKVTLTVDADDVKAIEDLGYTVKYKFYRSTKKAASYKAKIEGTGKTYINTTGKKGTRYYYKARVMVYDAEGTLVAKSALKQCKYACRIR